ncbi:MAG TPA: glycosyltransferase [Candidatus Krumholzibacteria bacterium]|nr:glycosyltransferase [Candidatus Krumholzibacteria bacterium]
MQVVWFAEIKWDYLRTRKQQLIERRPRDVDIVFFEPFVRGRENHYQLRDADSVRVATVPFIKSAPGGPARFLLDRALVRRGVDAAAVRRVRGHLRAAGVARSECVFVISNVYAIGVAAALAPRALVYDCNDAHAEFPGMPAWTADYQRRTFCRADTVIVSSRGLIDAARTARGSDADIHLVGNGVDFALFNDPALTPPEIPPETVRVGYVGAIAPWFDFGLVAALAAKHPEWQIVLVGPVLAGAESDAAALAAHRNVVLSGAIAHADVPAVLRRFTVGMIPFRHTPLTAGVNPNKLYEYLAAGLPTVATPFSPDVSAQPDVVALADGVEAFSASCRALTEARRDPARRAAVSARAAAIAREHDWDVIARRFWECVAMGAGSR